MAPMSSASSNNGSVTRVGDLIGTFLLSYLIAVALILALVDTAGVWNVLANTRLLDPLISAGFIKYHDMQMGFVHGIPDAELYLLSQDPVDWRLMLVVVLLLLIYWLIKAVQFHGLARFCGVGGGFGEHTRAFYYGVGLNSLLPYNIGELAAAEALEGQGQRFRDALNALVMPIVLRFNADHVGDKYARLAEAMELSADADVAEAHAALNDRLGIPSGLRAMGVREDQIPALAEQAIGDHCNATNPRPAEAVDYRELFAQAMG